MAVLRVGKIENRRRPLLATCGCRPRLPNIVGPVRSSNKRIGPSADARGAATTGCSRNLASFFRAWGSYVNASKPG